MHKWSWPLRAFLFVPAHRQNFVAKAIASGTDAVILDLEDSVPLDQRDLARSCLKAEIAELAAAGIAPFVRINAGREDWAADLDAAVWPGLAGIIVPKATTAEDIRDLADMLSYREGARGLGHGQSYILPCPETAYGLQHAEELAAASPRVSGILGTISGTVSADVARAFGFQPTMEGSEQLYMNSKLVLDSRSGGADFPIAGVFGVPLGDLAALEGLILRAKRLGYTGCPVMHPSHVAVVQKVFTPTAEEAAYFEGLLTAFAAAEAAGQGAVNYQGMMIDYAMIPLARQITEEFKRRQDKSASAASGEGK